MVKINFKDDELEGIVNNLNSCIDDLTEVNNIFYNLDLPYDLKNKSILNNLIEEIKKQKDNIIDYKFNFNKYINELNKNELELLSKISKLEDINIEKF